MSESEKQSVLYAVALLTRLKFELTQTLPARRNPSDFEHVLAVIQYIEWIGATVAEVYPPPPRHERWVVPEAPWPDLNSMSEQPLIPGFAHAEPPLPSPRVTAMPSMDITTRNLIVVAIQELGMCRSDFGVATCSRVQRLFAAVGGAADLPFGV